MCVVSLAAVFSLVTQRSSPQTLRDETKNGCEGDYNVWGCAEIFCNMGHEATNNIISCRKICELNIGHEATNNNTSHAGKYAN